MILLKFFEVWVLFSSVFCTEPVLSENIHIFDMRASCLLLLRIF